MNKPTAIWFDVDDTLYGRSQPFVRTCEALLFDRMHLDWEELFRVRNIYSDEVFEASQKGEISMEEYYYYRLQKALVDFGYDISMEEVLEFEHLYEKCQGEISPDKEVYDYLTYLTEMGIPVGIITNGPSGHQRNKILSLSIEEWIPRKYWIISGEVGTVKPYPEIFQIAADKMGLSDVSDAWFVGDNFQLDVGGAKKAGWHAIWFNRRKEDLPAQSSFQPDSIVYDSAELFSVFKEFTLHS